MTKKTESKVPKRRFQGDAGSTWMRTLETGQVARNEILDQQGWNGRRVLGFKLPKWQRPERWTDEQSASFVESVFLGANIGSFMYNSHLHHELSEILLDGQQRLRALERYWNSEFGVTGEDGAEHRWTDLSDLDKAHMRRITFPYVITQYSTEGLMREAYNRHNFSGTAHLITEMAPDTENMRDAALAPKM